MKLRVQIDIVQIINIVMLHKYKPDTLCFPLLELFFVLILICQIQIGWINGNRCCSVAHVGF